VGQIPRSPSGSGSLRSNTASSATLPLTRPSRNQTG